jgi:Acyltransferase family
VIPGIILAVTEESAMTSSQEVLASPYEVPAGPGQRQHWADNLRVLVIAAVVVWRTAQAYLEGSSWYYMDRATSKVWTAAFYPAYLVSFLALGPLFLVAGWFSARSLVRKGPGAFARSRLRLGVPLIVFIFLIDRLAAYLGDLGYGFRPSLAPYWGAPPRYGGPYAVGSLWFVAALLAFSLAYALLRRVHPAPSARRWSGTQVMVAAVVLIAATALLVWQRWPLGEGHTFMLAERQLWPQGRGCSPSGCGQVRRGA